MAGKLQTFLWIIIALGLEGCGNARLFRIVETSSLGPDWIDPQLCPLNDGRCTNCTTERLSRYRALIKSLRARGTPVFRPKRNLFPYDTFCNGNIYDDLAICAGTPSIADCVDAGGSEPVITRGIGSDNEKNLETFGYEAIIRRHALMFAFRAQFRDCDSKEGIIAEVVRQEKEGEASRSHLFARWRQDIDVSGDWTWWPVELVSYRLGLVSTSQLQGERLLDTITEGEFDFYLAQYVTLAAQYSCSELKQRILTDSN